MFAGDKVNLDLRPVKMVEQFLQVLRQSFRSSGKIHWVQFDLLDRRLELTWFFFTHAR